MKQYASAKRVPGLLLVRVDAPLFFANVAPVADALRKYEREATADGDGAVKAVVIDLSPVTDVDASAVHFLAAYVRGARARGLDVALANPSCDVAKILARAGLDALVGRDRVFVRVGDAVDALRAAAPLPVAGAAGEKEGKEAPTGAAAV